jgi:hypothetical protein
VCMRLRLHVRMWVCAPERMSVCVRLCAGVSCLCVCVRLLVRACARVRVRLHMCTSTCSACVSMHLPCQVLAGFVQVCAQSAKCSYPRDTVSVSDDEHPRKGLSPSLPPDFLTSWVS